MFRFSWGVKLHIRNSSVLTCVIDNSTTLSAACTVRHIMQYVRKCMFLSKVDTRSLDRMTDK